MLRMVGRKKRCICSWESGRYSTGALYRDVPTIVAIVYSTFSLSGMERRRGSLWDLVSRYLRRVGSTNTRARAKAYPELEFGGERMG